MVTSKYEEVRRITVKVYIGEDGSLQLSGDKLTAMDERCSAGDRICIKKSKDELVFQSCRGNMSQGWNDISSKWMKYSEMMKKGEFSEDIDQMLKDGNEESKVTDKEERLTIISDMKDNKAINETEVTMPNINTDISIIADGNGEKELEKNIKKRLNSNNGKEAAKAVENKIHGNKTGIEEDEDSEQIKLKKYMEDPKYQSIRNGDGSYTIAKSQIHRHRYEIRACGELNSTTFTTSVKIYLVDCYNGKENIGACKSIPTRSIRQGGTNLINLILDFGTIFSMAEANYANGRLFVLLMNGRMVMQDLDNYYSFSQTVDWFKEYITNGLAERAKNINNKVLWHPEIYLEEISYGPRSEQRGKHIVCGIWQSDFRKHYKSLMDEGKVNIKESEFLKQCKQQHILLPDAGRGGGQHTPGEPTCRRYGRSGTERIQRFCFDRRSLQVMWNTETVFRLLGGGTYH